MTTKRQFKPEQASMEIANAQKGRFARVRNIRSNAAAHQKTGKDGVRMNPAAQGYPVRFVTRIGWLAALVLVAGTAQTAQAQFTVSVQTPSGAAVTGFRWLLEEDNTLQPVPGQLVSDSIAVSIHNSHAPVVSSGHSATSSAVVNVPTDKRYFISILPDQGHTLSGAAVPVGATQVTVTVNILPIPTAQMSVLVFKDTSPINNAPEVPVEEGLAGFHVNINDTGGQQLQDAFGNMIGTEYALGVCSVSGGACQINENCPAGETCGNSPTGPLLDVDGSPFIAQDALGNPLVGNGVITTNFAGEALIKYLPPGKYGVQIIPPAMPPGQEWIQTVTIEGTPTIDAWIKAAEPTVFVEVGPAAWHVFFGFVQEFDTLGSLGNPGDPTGSITGKLVFNHFSRPPATQGFFPGEALEEGYVGLNDFTSSIGHYVAPANADGTFTITGIPAGTYSLVSWDVPLQAIFNIQLITIPDPVTGSWDLNLGDMLQFRWFGTLEGSVFYDSDQDGFRDAAEPGIPFQDVLLRFRDGTIYQATVTDLLGGYSFSGVFPFFKWLIVEVGFLTMKDTGYTNVVDHGGQIPPDAGWIMPSRDKLNPQPQFSARGACAISGKPCHIDEHCDTTVAEACVGAVPLINPNTGNNLSRTASGGAPGEFLLQAMFNFLNQTNVIDWGKVVYGPGDSGGLSGIVFYAVTRAEDDPTFAVGEPWEPGIPRVQVNAYLDANYDGIIDDLDGDLLVTLADVDNHPLGWAAGGLRGPEDVDRDDPVFDPGVDETAAFYPGDAIQIAHTDSFDDNKPAGCIQNLPTPHGTPVAECFDNFATWNQLRPGVFDGGWAMSSHFPGGMANTAVEVDGLPAGVYIVEAVPPPGYETVKEQDKNVDFGETYVPNGTVAALPPPCVGDPHSIPPILSLFGDMDGDGICDPGQDCVRSPFTGLCVAGFCEGGSTPGAACIVDADCPSDIRPMCDRKQVIHSAGQNSGVEHFMFTPVPKAARAVGFINNDFGAEFDVRSPIFGEKQAPAWVPISFMDFQGNEITRTYSDEWGAYNALLPSSFTTNIGATTGISQNMITFVVNDPGPVPDPNNPGQFITDPFYNSSFSQSPFTFQFESGKTTYLDTPVVPTGAFASFRDRSVDIDPPSGTPVLYSVMRTLGAPGGPVVCANGESVTISSMGMTTLPNPLRILDGVCVASTGLCDGGVNSGGPCATDNDCLGNALTITRDYGFGFMPGLVEVDGVPLNIVSWTDSTIEVTVDTALVSTGRLLVTRGDNGLATPLGLTLHVVADCATEVTYVSGGSVWPSKPIQDAVDAATVPGELIVVGPGTYNANVIVYKNVRIQGSGAGSTWINGNPVPLQRIGEWHDKILALITAGLLINVDADANLRFFEAAEAPCLFFQGMPGMFTAAAPGLIDGLTITGDVSGGGVYLTANNDFMQISHNKIFGNQGTFGGGITVGLNDQNVSNASLMIQHNVIAKNGGMNGGGGVTFFSGATGYNVVDNLLAANFTRRNGGAVAHLGLSDGGLIARNDILLNECFGPVNGSGAGIYLADLQIVVGALPGGGGAPPPGALGTGAGNISIVDNVIRGNLAGAGTGGGIDINQVNGEDLNGPPASWYAVNVFNNFIVDNVSTFRGGAMSIHNAARVNIIHNTIANNDSTATNLAAFTPGNDQQSNSQVGGIASTQHSPAFAALSGQTFSNPVLANNIIWHNRSFFYDRTLNNALGGLIPSVPMFRDLEVLGGGAMNPIGSIVTDTTGLDPSNIGADPGFFTEYNNTFEVAGVIDEAGGFVSVRYPELSITGSDYHLACCSPALDAGVAGVTAPFAELALDIDGRPRPRPISGGLDIGADEVDALFDVDSDCTVGPGDFSFLVPCWLLCDTDPAWATFSCGELDFDCTGCVDPGDFSFFVNAWLKPCDDPSVVLPACHAPAGSWPLPLQGVPDTLLPATREVVESFGLTYPDASDPRFKRDSQADRPHLGSDENERLRSRKSRANAREDQSPAQSLGGR